MLFMLILHTGRGTPTECRNRPYLCLMRPILVSQTGSTRASLYLVPAPGGRSRSAAGDGVPERISLGQNSLLVGWAKSRGTVSTRGQRCASDFAHAAGARERTLPTLHG